MMKNKSIKELKAELETEKNEKEAISNRLHRVTNIINTNKQVLSRLGYMNGGIFTSHDGKRDYGEIFGYPPSLSYEDFMESYERGDIASRIIDAPVSAVWSSQPTVVEKNKENEDTKFNKAWQEIVKATKLYHYIRRADKLNRLGRFSILYLGFSGSDDLSKPVKRGDKLIYVRPFGERSVQIPEFEGNMNSPRFGKPLYYSITTTDPLATGSARDTNKVIATRVHYSRVIHITEDNLTSEIYSTPALQKVYNRLVDITKVVGGSAEMFWRGARPGYTAVADSDAKFTEADELEMEQQLDDFDNNLTRWLQLQGIKVTPLDSQVYTPEQHFKVLTACIASAVGIPQRILIGAESGELASSMDERNWNNRILERRKDFAEPNIIIPIVEHLIELGLLPSVEYQVIWQDLNTLTEKDKAEVAYKNSVAIMNFFNSVLAQEVIGAKVFARDVMQFPEEVVAEIVAREKTYEKRKNKQYELEIEKLETEIKEPKEEQKQGEDNVNP